MIIRTCEGCFHATRPNMEKFLLDGRPASLKPKPCQNCFWWKDIKANRTNYKGLSREHSYSCEGCAQQTHEDMEEFLATPQKGGITKSEICDRCYYWNKRSEERKNYEEYVAPKKKRVRKPKV